MKQRTTKKYIQQNYKYRIVLPNAYNLLNLHNADYYTARAEGWGADYYIINSDVVVLYGDDPTAGNRSLDYRTCTKYDDKARAILTSSKYKKLDTKRRRLNALLLQLIKKEFNIEL